MNVLQGLPRGVNEKKARIPREQWANPDMVRNQFPYDGTQISPGALGDELTGLNTEQGLVTTARSGTGKSVQLKGNIVHYRGNMLIIDPKGEMADETALWRETVLDQDIYFLPLGIRIRKSLEKYSSTWNPLENLKDPETLLEDIGLIADALIIHDPNSESHWPDSAKTFLEAVILHVITCPIYEGKRHLITVHRLIGKGVSFPGEEQSSISGLCKEMLHQALFLKTKDEDLSEALEAGTFDFFERTDKERDSVLSTLRTNLKFLGYKAVRKILTPDPNKKHLTSLDLLKKKRMTLYISPAAGRLAMFNRMLRLLVNLTLESVEREKTPPPVPVLLVLDEFPVLGYMRQLDVAAGFIRGFGVKLWIICQNLSQIKNLYKEGWETFLGNNCLQFFGNNDQFTLNYIEERCGKTPVTVVQQSIQKTEAVGSESISHEMHPLITAQEAAKYFSPIDPLKRQLVIVPGHDPIILQRIEWYRKDAPYHQKNFSKFCRFLEERNQ
ncbi:MAG: type IV secretory system conjugative DNA transfer family protein [Nitrospira sp.]|nr:type IV secretory system conjugative DNA transfer family protein [Nitrospira sp.]